MQLFLFVASFVQFCILVCDCGYLQAAPSVPSTIFPEVLSPTEWPCVHSKPFDLLSTHDAPDPALEVHISKQTRIGELCLQMIGAQSRDRAARESPGRSQWPPSCSESAPSRDSWE